MQTRNFIILAALTGAVVVGAVFSVLRDRPVTDGMGERTHLFPGLLDRVNEIDFVEVTTTADGTISARREGDVWGVVQRHGHPADFEVLRGMLVELARLETIERRTDEPALYRKLQVEDQDGDAAASIRITAGIGGETAADLLVGRTRAADAGGGVFVRKVGDARTWLAAGSFQPVRLLTRLLDRNIMNVEMRRVRQVTLTHADGETVTVRKGAPTDGDYDLATPPGEGRRAKPPFELSPLASWLDFLILDDVRPAAEVDFSRPDVTGRFETFDGLVVEARMKAADDARWVTLRASPGAVHEKTPELIEARKAMKPEELEGTVGAALRTPGEVEAEIGRINRTTAAWAYKATDYKTGKLGTRLADITEPVAE